MLATVVGHWWPPSETRSRCPWRCAADRWVVGDLCPDGVDALAFRHGAVEGEGLLSLDHRCCWRDFLRKVLGFGEEDFEYRDSTLNKVVEIFRHKRSDS